MMPLTQSDRGVETLTPARAIIAEMIRRYRLLGLECSILEVQKLAWLVTRVLHCRGMNDPLKLSFDANRYGPFAPQFTHLLNALDGSFLHCEKRVADASPFEAIHFDPGWKARLLAYFATAEAAPYVEAIDTTDQIIDGFQSPLGMEALATVDWLLNREHAEPSLAGIRQAIRGWRGGPAAADRKQRLFSDRLIEASIGRLKNLLP
jgi:hypothetical protein